MNFGNSAFWRNRLTRSVRSWRPYALLAVLSAMLCLPGLFALPLTGSAEGYATQIARQSAQRGLSLHLSFQDLTLSPRPQGNVWLQTLSAMTFGNIGSVWPYRLLSFLALLATSIFIFVAGRALFTPERGLLSALLFLITPAALLAGQSAFSAALATALITLNITALILAQRHNSRRPGALPFWMIALFWLSAGTGVLVCGVLPLLTVSGVLLAVRIKDGTFRGLRGLFPFWGVLCGLLPALPWIFALKEAWQSPPHGADLARLFFGGDYVPWQLPGGNFLPLLLLIWPGIFFLTQALYLLHRKRTRQALLCIGWLLPPLMLTALLPVSAPLLMLPALPGICLLCADFVLSPERMPTSGILRGLVWTACLLGAFLPLLASGLLSAGIHYLQAQPLIELLPPFLAAIFATTACWYIHKGARLRLCLLSLIFSLVAIPLVCAVLLPALRTSWLPLQVAQEYGRFFTENPRLNRGDHTVNYLPSRLVCLGMYSPEIVFYTGASTLLTSNPIAAADQILTCPGDCLAVHEDFNAAVLQAMQDRRLIVTAAGSVSGFYPPQGRMATVYFYTSSAPASAYDLDYPPENGWGGGDTSADTDHGSRPSSAPGDHP